MQALKPDSCQTCRLFLCEGVPTVILGLWMRGSLVASPAKATFLTPDERDAVIQRLARNKVCLASEANGRTGLVPVELIDACADCPHGSQQLSGVDRAVLAKPDPAMGPTLHARLHEV